MHRDLCNLSVISIQHPCGGIVPHIGHRVGTDAQVKQVKFLLECRELVVQCPQDLASFRPSEHIVLASFGYSIPEQGKYGYKFGGCLDIEVVHVHGSHDALWAVAHGILQLAKRDENLHTVIVQMGIGFDGRRETACRLKVTVVLFLPLAHLLKLCGNGILQKGCFLLAVNLVFDFA